MSFSHVSPIAPSGVSIRLVITRPVSTAAKTFQLIALSGPLTPTATAGSVLTFTLPAPIAVQEGDVLGMESLSGAQCILMNQTPGGSTNYLSVGAVGAIGSTFTASGVYPGGSSSQYALNIAAKLVAR